MPAGDGVNRLKLDTLPYTLFKTKQIQEIPRRFSELNKESQSLECGDVAQTYESGADKAEPMAKKLFCGDIWWNDTKNGVAYLKFDLSNLREGYSKAILRLYTIETRRHIAELDVSVVDDGWAGDKLAWEKRPATVRSLGRMVAEASDWVELDITEAVRGKAKEGKTLSLGISAVDPSSTAIVASPMYSTLPETKPMILVYP